MLIWFNFIYNLNLSWLKQNFSRSYKLLHVFWNTLYEISSFNGLKIMTKVKVFVHISNADTDANMDADAKAMTLNPQTFIPAR